MLHSWWVTIWPELEAYSNLLHMAGIHRFLYMKWLLVIFRVYYKISMCTWSSWVFNECWHGQGLWLGCLCMSRGCWEGYGVLFRVGTVNPQLHKHSRMPYQGLIKMIKGSHPQSLIQSGRNVRGPQKWSVASFPGRAPFQLTSHEPASSASVITWCVSESFVLSPCVMSYKSPGPLDMPLGSSSEWIEWYVIEYINIGPLNGLIQWEIKCFGCQVYS